MLFGENILVCCCLLCTWDGVDWPVVYSPLFLNTRHPSFRARSASTAPAAALRFFMSPMEHRRQGNNQTQQPPESLTVAYTRDLCQRDKFETLGTR